jgi:hypothetical protein
MYRQSRHQQPSAPASGGRGLRLASWLRHVVAQPGVRFAVAVAAFAIAAGAPAAAFELRLSTENDLITSERAQDDLYTFAVALEVERGPYAFTLRENAFTDRAAGVRFDETYLTMGRALPAFAPWQVRGEIGVVHVGRGLLGEDAQNFVHDVTGDPLVELTYERSHVHPHAALTASRAFAAGERLDLGPVVQLDTVPGLRHHALAGVQAEWRPREWVAVHAMAGGRWSEATFAPLSGHLDGLAAAARVRLEVLEKVFLSWSYNDFGDEREHLSLGYVVGTGRARGGRGPR